ncbi:Ligand-binding SRPBCC domain-containing protein [Lutibacter agarilyticus]|uniref:Ligand-binding SRPBCC domain-containing protein n=1 Tax=Lutibacter agarilyticus TaxID=1109740 RepID=A0A238YR95_9FLAO|nr:SRPBCC family protein [Lutibacter agarilyticus]SNR73502.1 Ligand-binding SRPBCC domain-containing protein [Lutibacter agarilyticus]
MKFSTKGKVYRLSSTQRLPISMDDAWDFLSNPANLKEITPKYMSFDIISGADRPMFAGQIIQYIVTPILGIKTTWVTEITHVVDKEYFVDEQRFGPYALWHHKHFIKPVEGGVEMEDIIDYKVPLGFLGRLVHPILVKPKLIEIFNHRTKKLIELFGEIKN